MKLKLYKRILVLYLILSFKMFSSNSLTLANMLSVSTQKKIATWEAEEERKQQIIEEKETQEEIARCEREWKEYQQRRADKLAVYLKNKREKMAENKRMFGREKCVFCFNSGTPSRVYLSHCDLKNCPKLVKALCGKCGLRGHTRKHCKSQQDKRIRLPFKYNRRPTEADTWDEMYMNDYSEGNSEDWSDSDDEKETKTEIFSKKEEPCPVIKNDTIKEPVKEPVKNSWASIVKNSK